MLLSSACAVPVSSDSSEAEAQLWEGEEGTDALRTKELELSSNESCDTVGANRSIFGWPSNFTTGSNYGTSGCHKAYRIDAHGYVGYDFNNDPRQVHYFGYGESMPSDCGRARFALYVWEDGDLIASKWVWGEIGTVGGVTGCYAAIPPVANFNLVGAFHPPNGLTAGVDYRFAMTARLYNKARDSSSGYVTKKIRSWTADRGEFDDLL